jgi:hypothetical protein
MNPSSEASCLGDARASAHSAAATGSGFLVFGWLLAVPAMGLTLPITRTNDFTVNNVQDQTGNNVAPAFKPH